MEIEFIQIGLITMWEDRRGPCKHLKIRYVNLGRETKWNNHLVSN